MRRRAAGRPTRKPIRFPRVKSDSICRGQSMPERPREFVPVRIALMTVSDTRTRENDVSGDTLEARVSDAGHLVAERVIVPDDIARIADQLVKWIADPEI